MATAADPGGYPVGRWIACVFHILTPASMGLASVLKCTVDTLRYTMHSLEKIYKALLFISPTV